MNPEHIRADYAYLDDLDPKGYLWEFIRRNRSPEQNLQGEDIIKRKPQQTKKDGYQDIFYRLQKGSPEVSIVEECNVLSPSEIIVSIASDSPDVAWCLDKLKMKFGITVTFLKEKSVGYLPIKVKGSDKSVGLPDPSLGYDKIRPEPSIRGFDPIASSVFNEHAWERFGGDYLSMLVDKLTISSRDRTIYIGIPSQGKPHEIKMAIDKLIKQRVRPVRDVNKAPKAWKKYLIYYDLAVHYGLKEPMAEAAQIAHDVSKYYKPVSSKAVYEALIKIRAIISTEFANFLFLP